MKKKGSTVFNQYVYTYSFQVTTKSREFHLKTDNGNIRNQMSADKRLIRENTALSHIELLQKISARELLAN